MTPKPAAEAPVCALEPGIQTVTVDVAGTPRSALVRRGSAATTRAPAVFVWHGYGSSAENMLDALRPEAEFDDAVVIAASGLDRTFAGFGDTPRPGWQIRSGEHGDRDLALFDALMTELEPCVDPKAVSSTGFSNGGFFSNLLACERPGALAAIAPVGGGLTRAEACPTPVPTLIIHGRQDPIVPFTSGTRAAEVWHLTNGCSGAAIPEGEACLDATCETPLRVCPFEGKHTWPDFATAEIAGFFADHR